MDSVTPFLEPVWNLISTPFIHIKGSGISFLTFILGMILFVVASMLAKRMDRLVARLLKDVDMEEGLKESLGRFARYTVLIVGMLVTLQTIGIDLSSLAAIGAMLTVGIGFGLQNITQNFISGLIILIERPIKKGDVVKVGDVTGRVAVIGARSTLIHTRDDVAIIVPNSQFIAEQVINESFSGDRIRLHLKVGVAYGSDVELVRKVLVEISKTHQNVLDFPAPSVLFKDFGDSSLDFELLIWVKNLWVDEVIRSELRYLIDKRFREENIQIPFPQRDLHLKSNQTKSFT